MSWFFEMQFFWDKALPSIRIIAMILSRCYCRAEAESFCTGLMITNSRLQSANNEDKVRERWIGFVAELIILKYLWGLNHQSVVLKLVGQGFRITDCNQWMSSMVGTVTAQAIYQSNLVPSHIPKLFKTSHHLHMPGLSTHEMFAIAFHHALIMVSLLSLLWKTEIYQNNKFIIHYQKIHTQRTLLWYYWSTIATHSKSCSLGNLKAHNKSIYAIDIRWKLSLP